MKDKEIKQNKKRIITLVLIIAWMIIVFYLSNQSGDSSGILSQKLTGKIIKIQNLKSINQESFFQIDELIRKIAHFILYALGGLLIYIHVKTYNLEENSKVILTQIIGTTYALTDEFHQLLIPGRSGEVRDILIDSLGIAIGILLIVLIDMIKKKKEGSKVEK